MLYQTMLVGKTPYRTFITTAPKFPNHAHLEIEILYCLRGTETITVNGKPYLLSEGRALLVDSMTGHEMLTPTTECRLLVIEIGPIVLRGHFKKLSALSRVYPLISCNDALKRTFDETANFIEVERENDLIALSQIYKICGLLIKELDEKENEGVQVDCDEVIRIEKALQMIYGKYTLPITVDDAARETGYGKSNFCKIFKRAYGESFHKMLNRHRVENACYLLSETELGTEEVAQSVGFDDVKTFYRVFKFITGITPGEYKRNV